VIELFRKNGTEKYEIKAQEYLTDPDKTGSLLKKAFEKGNNRKEALGEAWDKLRLFIDFVKAYSNGEYRQVSKGTILTVIGAIIYFVSPLDLVPDFIVGLGILDDAAVIGFALKKIASELNDYKRWRIDQSKNPLE
jgi:uncharacterized membrane protein YkvA (DUF1232 family)